MSHKDPWKEMLSQHRDSSRESMEQKIARISGDPKPKWSEDPERDYPTTEKHFIVCLDPDKANVSMPEMLEKIGEPHKIGNFLVSDRRDVPEGWLKTPLKGTPITAIEKEHPTLFEALKEKGMVKF